MGPKKKSREQQRAGSITTHRQVLWCADVISVVAEFLPSTDQYQKPLMLVSKLWLEGVAQQHGMKALGRVHWPFAALRHRGSQKLRSRYTPRLSTADLEDLVENVPSSQISSLTLREWSAEADLTRLSTMVNLTALYLSRILLCEAKNLPRGLSALTWLTTLQVSSPVDNTDFDAISGLSRLESLHLSRSVPLTVESLNHLTKLKVLTSLSLNAEDVGCGDEHMKVIGQMTQLSELSLRVGNGFGDDGMELLSELLNLNRLKLWDMNSITGKGLHLLGKLKQLTHFRVSGEGCNMISNEDLVFFEELQDLQSFKLLLDDSFTLTDEGLEHITLGGARSLRKLNLSRWKSSVTAAGTKHLERLQQLKCVEIRTLPAPTDAAVASLASLAQLEHLDIYSGVTVPEFCVLTTFKKLKTLRVRFDEFAGSSSVVDTSHDNVSCLEDFHGSNANDLVLQRISLIDSLTALYVCDSPSITDDGVQHLSSLVNLETLTLTNLAITGSDFNGFGNKLGKLTNVKLQECENLEDHGIRHICEISSLKSLEVSRCGCLTDDAFSTIAKLRNVTCLRIVECADVQVGFGFTCIAHMRSLETLWLIDCDISSEFLHSLRSNESLQHLLVKFTTTWNKAPRFSSTDMEELEEHKEGAHVCCFFDK